MKDNEIREVLTFMEQYTKDHFEEIIQAETDAIFERMDDND